VRSVEAGDMICENDQREDKLWPGSLVYLDSTRPFLTLAVLDFTGD